MTATPFDSPVWRGVLHDPDLAPLFTDTAVLRAELLVMGTLALTQAKTGAVPEVSAKAIQRAAMEVQIDPAALSGLVAKTGDPVAALVAQFQAEMKAPEHANWVHQQSDTRLTAATGLSLRLRQCLKILSGRLGGAETPPVFAYHPDPEIAAGLAEGLNLGDTAGAHPDDAVLAIATWLNDTALALQARGVFDAALQHQMTHLHTSLHTAAPATRGMIIPMTLPQMVLGLGRLLRQD